MLFILDKLEKMVGVLSNKAPFSCPYYNDLHVENIVTGVHNYQFSVPAKHEMASRLEVEGFVILKDLDNKLQMFKIKDIEEDSSDDGASKSVFAEHVAIPELIGNIVRPQTLNGRTLEQASNVVVGNTGWNLGTVDFSGTQDIVFENFMTSLEALLYIAEVFEVEVQYEIIFENGKVKDRLIHLGKRGTNLKQKFSYGRDLQDVKRKTNSDEIITALIGVGKADEEGNRVSLQNFDYSSGQTPLPIGFQSPYDADYIYSEEALQNYSKDGKHIFGIFIDEKSTTQQSLFKRTLEELQRRMKPQVSYEMKVATLERTIGYDGSKARIGDSIIVDDTSFNPRILVDARITEVKRSYTEPENDELSLGDYKPIRISNYDSIEKLQQLILLKEATWNQTGITETEVGTIVDTKVAPISTKIDDVETDVGTVKTDLSNTKTEVSTVKTDLSSTKTKVDTVESDLSDTKTEVGTISTKVGSIETSVGDIQTDVSEVQTEVSKREYAIIKQDAQPVGNYIVGALWLDGDDILYRYDGTMWRKIIRTTPTEIGAVAKSVYDAKVSELNNNIQKKLDSSIYTAKVTELESLIADKLDSSVYTSKIASMESDIADKVDAEYVNGQLVVKADASDVYTKVESDSKLGSKADKSNTYTKTEVNNALNSKVSTITYTADMDGVVSDIDSHETRITQTETDIASKVSSSTYNQKVTELEGTLSDKADSVDVYTKTETDTKLSGKANNSTVSAIETRLSDAETSITQTDTEIGLKANKTDVYTKTEVNSSLSGKADNSTVSAIETRVDDAESELTVQAGQIASKVAKSTYDTKMSEVDGDLTAIETRVGDAETRITQTETGINLKADKTTVYTKGETDTKLGSKANQTSLNSTNSNVSSLTTRVSDAEAELDVQAGQISLKASQDDLDSVSGRLDSAESELTVQAGQIASKVAKTTYDTKVSQLESGINSKEKAIKKQSTTPTGSNGDLWLDTSVTPNVLKQHNGTTWVKASPTTASEVGAYSKGETDTKLSSKADSSTVGVIETRVTSAESRITQTETNISLKADKTTVYTKGETDTKLGGKANQTSLNTTNNNVSALTTRVTDAEAEISVNSEAISLKASKSDLDTVTGRVDDAEAELTVQAGQIASKVSSSTYNTKISQIEGNVSSKADSTSVYTKGETDTKLGTKANSTDVYTKAQTDTKLGGKADTSTVTAIETRLSDAETSITQTNTAIGLKANSTDVYTKTETNTKLGTKADTTYVNSEVGKKADTTYVSTELGKKADTSYVNTELGKKADDSDVTSLETRVSEAESELSVQAGQINLKASASTVYTKTETDTKVNAKANQSSLNTTNSNVSSLTTRMSSAESSLSVQAGQIASKVSQSTYDADIPNLKTRMNSAESTITQHAGQITSKVSTTDYTGNKVVSMLNQTATTIKLDASKIELNGKVKFTDLDSSAQGTINGKASQSSVNSINGILNSAVTTIDGSGITVKDGSFFLEDSISSAKYSVVSKRNMLQDHGFELSNGSGYNSSYRWFDYDNPIGSLGIYNYNKYWYSVGVPKITQPSGADGSFNNAIFGQKSMVVNSTNYVYQGLVGLSASTTYTVSAFFKRHGSGGLSGGTPKMRIVQIQEFDGSTMWSSEKTFSAVPSDYRVVRNAHTFTLPSNYTDGDGVSLQIQVMGSNGSWVQVDGVQLVEGPYPVLYDSEDTTYSLLNGNIGFIGILDMQNNDIRNANALHFNDAGGSEGIFWSGGYEWRIVSSPDDLSNGDGPLQIASGNTRRATFGTTGNFYITGSIMRIQNSGGSFEAEGDLYIRDTVSGSNMRFTKDGSPYVQSTTIYDRTYSSSSNVYVTQYGTLGRSTSAKKYKLEIQDVDADKPKRILDVKPRTWVDKASAEAYADYLTKTSGINRDGTVAEVEEIDTDEVEVPFIERVPGMIAEEVIEAGLGEYVIYGKPDKDGNREVEGLMYDRLWTLLVPIVKEQQARIEELERKLL
jgi:phage minor structural protein